LAPDHLLFTFVSICSTW